jgi:RNA polymerase sigma-70 factor (ECF subfamily)
MSSATIDQPVEFTLPNPTGSSGGPVRSPDLDSAAEKRPETPPASLGTPELDAIYQENSRPIYYLALRMLGDPTQAEDATHDVFLKAYRKLGEFKGQSSIRTWLYRITINHCQNLLQTWHRRHIHGTDDDEIWERAAGASESPLRILETRELGQRIQKTLQAIPEEYRLLLLLVADEKLSYEEIGTLTGQSSDAVRGKLHRARKAFTVHFQKNA